MLRKLSWFLGALVGLLLLPVILPVMGIRRLLGLHRRKVGPEHLVAFLEKAAFGVESEDDWADLKQAPFRDRDLEALRRRAIAFAPPVKLDRDARDALYELLEEAKALQTTSAEP